MILKRTVLRFMFTVSGILLFSSMAHAADKIPNTDVFFGDTHLHTSYSPDAYLMGNRSDD